jgi:hypothetical protein
LELKNMAQSFEVQENLQKLLAQHPSPEEFREALVGISKRSREHVVRLWLTEGTPFAFRNCPALYEEMRRWLGTRLEVCPKEITVVGSARIGFSLAGGPDFGRPFDKNSDLDVAVISGKLLTAVAETFARWKHDYTNGVVRPRSDWERHLWEENLKFGERNLPLGFFDVNKLPTFDRYPLVQDVQNTMWTLGEKLKVTPKILLPRRASVRAYATWRALVERVSFNLFTVLGKS